MKTIAAYAFEIRTPAGFDEAVRRVTDALAQEGFGVLTEIDVRQTLKAKLGVDTPPMKILGACHPPTAHQVLAAEPLVGVLLPCSVTVRDAGDHRVVAAMEPRLLSEIVGGSEIEAIVGDASARLHRALAAVERS